MLFENQAVRKNNKINQALAAQACAIRTCNAWNMLVIDLTKNNKIDQAQKHAKSEYAMYEACLSFI